MRPRAFSSRRRSCSGSFFFFSAHFSWLACAWSVMLSTSCWRLAERGLSLTSAAGRPARLLRRVLGLSLARSVLLSLETCAGLGFSLSRSCCTFCCFWRCSWRLLATASAMPAVPKLALRLGVLGQGVGHAQQVRAPDHVGEVGHVGVGVLGEGGGEEGEGGGGDGALSMGKTRLPCAGSRNGRARRRITAARLVGNGGARRQVCGTLSLHLVAIGQASFKHLEVADGAPRLGRPRRPQARRLSKFFRRRRAQGGRQANERAVGVQRAERQGGR